MNVRMVPKKWIMEVYFSKFNDLKYFQVFFPPQKKILTRVKINVTL